MGFRVSGFEFRVYKGPEALYTLPAPHEVVTEALVGAEVRRSVKRRLSPWGIFGHFARGA